MEKIIFMKCPICRKDVKSDATASNFCKLCGMISKEEFCCIDCEGEYDRIIGV